MTPGKKWFAILFFRVLVLRKAPNTAKAQVPSPLDSAGPKYDKNGDMVPYSILGTVQEFYRMNYERGRLQATVKGIHRFTLFVWAKIHALYTLNNVGL